MRLSKLGTRLAGQTGINALMADLGETLAASADPAPLMLGGGNPAHIPAMELVLGSVPSSPPRYSNGDPHGATQRFRGAFPEEFAILDGKSPEFREAKGFGNFSDP